MNSATGPIPGGWKFGLRDSISMASSRLVGRIMIGKLPAGRGFPETEALLSQVPLPAEINEDNCLS
ncbi:hypothetical protein ISF_01226 [Cordyceps fumosorosea ARSEF 2679]|uniref:Uncharacterized protein n=1 Tax=Cordyceps fumosorosea (strain ARSEF 2679) TaxID=1081104 RepID=A0A168D498_CORFA|nr:hypothetical protein ISF_01226 [Cordyceps fumosorosea ARSEF 2679]OAA72153.1 hypothetical protein ISF_01226 [Cordyceps fumosorosea ARSEF 2679]